MPVPPTLPAPQSNSTPSLNSYARTLKPAPPASPPPTHRRCIKIHLTTRHLTDTPAPNSNSHPSLKSCARRTNRLRRHRHNQELPTLPCISTKKNTDTPRALLRLSPSLNSSAHPLKSTPPPSSRDHYTYHHSTDNTTSHRSREILSPNFL